MLNINPIKKELELFEKSLKEIVTNERNFLKDDLEKFLFAPSKRLRPIFVFLFSKILKIDNPYVINIALASELIHSASLIHDDIIDEADTRRNSPALYKKFNSKLATLLGDLLLTESLQVLSKTNIQIVEVFSKKIKETLDGELEQNSYINTVPDEKTYLKKTFNKTGNLFLAGLEALFCLGDFQSNIKESLYNFTKNFSYAFQIKNDTNDLNSDIDNGNYTLVVLYFLMENSIDKLNNNPDFNKYIKQANKKIEEYKDLAIQSLETIEDSIFKTALIEISEEILRSL